MTIVNLFDKLLKREYKRINTPFEETYPKVYSTTTPNNIPYEEWKKKWATVERKSIIETLKETK
jgi:hypothetical protein